MPSPYSQDLSDICDLAIDQLTARNKAREQALAISREVIRLSANAIRAVHRGEFEEAKKGVAHAGARLKETEQIRLENP